jgi:hypothetical protein
MWISDLNALDKIGKKVGVNIIEKELTTSPPPLPRMRDVHSFSIAEEPNRLLFGLARHDFSDALRIE